MASVDDYGPRKWRVRWVEPGPDGRRRQRSRVVTTAKTRDKLLKDVEQCEELGVRYEPAAAGRAVPAIGDAMTAFVTDIARIRAPGTIKLYVEATASFCDYLDEAGQGFAAVADLSRDMLAGFYSALEHGKHGKTRSADTKRRIVERIEAAWRWLFDTEWDPAVPRPKTIEMPSSPAKAVRAPTWDEMAACVHACVSEGPRRLTTLLYFTGVRVGHALDLTWDAVDLERAVITWAPHKGLPGFLQPMSPHLVAAMKGWGTREGHVITWRPTRQVRERVIAEAWARAGVRAEVWQRRQDHAFRKGITSNLAAAGVQAELAEGFVGHAVRGARAHYLDKGFLPLCGVAEAIPPLTANHFARVRSVSHGT